jgi:hypothetical protein
VPNNGTHPWTVTGPTTVLGRIRVTSVSFPTFKDSSDSAFSIVQPALQVAGPVAGEIWPPGRVRRIRWVASGIGKTVKLEVSRDGGTNWETITDSTPSNDGFEDWLVTGPNSANAVIRVSSVKLPGVTATSPSFVIGPPTLAVTSPAAGRLVRKGEVLDIRWTQIGIDGPAAIDLSRNGGGTWEALFPSASGGLQNWTVTGPPSTNALIRVRTFTIPLTATSGAFQISAPTLSVNAPNGGERLTVGGSTIIRWSSTDLPGTVSIQLSRNNGGTWESLFPNTANVGQVSWTVTGPPTTQALVRLVSDADPTLTARSAGTFTILAPPPPPPTLTVQSPNGGEQWKVGTSQTIRWTSSVPNQGSVKIELSRDGGTTWQTIIGSTPNNGSKSWTVASPTSTKCRVRVTLLSDARATGTSNANFSITP